MAKLCNCGSGLERDELVDAAGIFCGFVCAKCEASVRAKFNPRIFEEWYDADKPDVEWPEPDPCPECGGDGISGDYVPELCGEGEDTPCQACHGTGNAR